MGFWTTRSLKDRIGIIRKDKMKMVRTMPSYKNTRISSTRINELIGLSEPLVCTLAVNDCIVGPGFPGCHAAAAGRPRGGPADVLRRRGHGRPARELQGPCQAVAHQDGQAGGEGQVKGCDLDQEDWLDLHRCDRQHLPGGEHLRAAVR